MVSAGTQTKRTAEGGRKEGSREREGVGLGWLLGDDDDDGDGVGLVG